MLERGLQDPVCKGKAGGAKCGQHDCTNVSSCVRRDSPDLDPLVMEAHVEKQKQGISPVKEGSGRGWDAKNGNSRGSLLGFLSNMGSPHRLYAASFR